MAEKKAAARKKAAAKPARKTAAKKADAPAEEKPLEPPPAEHGNPVDQMEGEEYQKGYIGVSQDDEDHSFAAEAAKLED